MTSIRTKSMLLTVFAVIICMTVSTLIGVIAIKNVGNSSAEQILHLLCEAGEKNLDSYFAGVEKSVDMVTAFVKADLRTLSEEHLEEHVDKVSEIFGNAATKTPGVLTYYYRLDPSVSQTVKGFWYVRAGDGFAAHEVTDISLYDTEDTGSLVWFTNPKKTGKSLWLPPYITENLDVRVISFNEPVFLGDRFVGVVGMEIDYTTMAEQVDNIKLYENGYAFLTGSDSKLVYHPHIDVTTTPENELPKNPIGLIGKSTFAKYTFGGVEKQAARLPLNNGMWLTVAVPVAEINSTWSHLIWELAAVSVVLLLVFILLTLRLTGQITKPLRNLTKAAEQVNAGNYDVELDYGGNDEVGILTYTFRRLIRCLKEQISDLNSLAYADALTSVRNKGAYDAFTQELQAKIRSDEKPEFAIVAFDCDNLKLINDQYGHDKGDIYLKTACSMICRVFQHSPVFRTGGDEFAVILQGEDYNNRTELACAFEEKSAETRVATKMPWDQVHVSMGVAAYRPRVDHTVGDVARRADKLMYDAKAARKAGRRAENH